MIKKVIVNDNNVVSIENLDFNKYYMFIIENQVWCIMMLNMKEHQSICLTNQMNHFCNPSKLKDIIKQAISNEIDIYEFDSIMEGMNFFIKDNLKNIS